MPIKGLEHPGKVLTDVSNVLDKELGEGLKKASLIMTGLTGPADVIAISKQLGTFSGVANAIGGIGGLAQGIAQFDEKLWGQVSSVMTKDLPGFIRDFEGGSACACSSSLALVGFHQIVAKQMQALGFTPDISDMITAQFGAKMSKEFAAAIGNNKAWSRLRDHVPKFMSQGEWDSIIRKAPFRFKGNFLENRVNFKRVLWGFAQGIGFEKWEGKRYRKLLEMG